jgi:hypothetical protein
MKDQKDLVGLSRKSIVNQLHALTESKPTYDMHGLVAENRFKWFFRNLANLGNTHYSYQSYLKPEENNGIFKISKEPGEEVSIALLSDWATDTAEAYNIAKMVGDIDAEYSIHLGDTYYVGNYKEIAKCFNSTLGAPWPYGKLGSFALLGNHEMYSSGRSYFTQLLPYMGSHTGTGFQQQEASFFCLENDHWRIIGLDTGYDSLKGWLGLKPNPKLKLHDKQIEWLQNTVRLNNDNRGIIFLSHHQYVSAFEEEFTAFGDQFASLIDPQKTILWFWGHEHRLAIYGRNKLPNGTQIFPRCIGHAGMPVEIGEKEPKSATPDDDANRNLVLYDDRVRNQLDGKIKLGHNGFVILSLNASKLQVRHYDDNKEPGQVARLLCTEDWEIDLSNGKLSGVDIRLEEISVEDKLHMFGNDINRAIQ